MQLTRGERVRLVTTTVVLTSLAWIAGLGMWSMQVGHQPSPVAAERERVLRPAPATPAAVVSVRAPVLPAGRLLIPVPGIAPEQLRDTFTESRASGARSHDAIDIPAPRGTPVRAAAPGKVEKLFLSRDGGNTVYVRSPDGRLLYYYAHLDGYAPDLAEGAQIMAGTVLGAVGLTGNSDPATPHLHFAIFDTRPESQWYDEKIALNPYPLLTRR